MDYLSQLLEFIASLPWWVWFIAFGIISTLVLWYAIKTSPIMDFDEDEDDYYYEHKKESDEADKV